MSLDQEYDADLAAMWQRLEEQLVAAANRGVIPVNFQPAQYCLNSQTQNLRQPLAVVEGRGSGPRAPTHPDADASISCLCPCRANYRGSDLQEPPEGSSGSGQPLSPVELFSACWR